ncbi:hypothetical protein [Frankia gtarii]|uniref:hypothetical protein n=1 Tax=Frankia gtarii TaxID=2950102 RepID=UPI0021C1AFE0|nr:hypothetical protein [Frankia gtarii]
MPEIVGDVKIAKLFDGMDGEVPWVRGRAPLPPGEERSRFVEYLQRGVTILRVAGLVEDLLDPSRGRKVSLVYVTDGDWVWSLEIVYYLQEHDLPPEPEFIDYVRSRDFRYVEPSEERVAAASRALDED